MLLLDNTSALAAYSLRRLTNSYTGPLVRVRRSLDGTELDIGFKTDGGFDKKALLTFAQGGNCFISKWYDQSGGNSHLTQISLALQPQIVSTGVLLTDELGYPKVVFQNTSLNGTHASGISNQNLTCFFLQELSPLNDKGATLLSLGKTPTKNLNYSVKNNPWGGVNLTIGDGSSGIGMPKELTLSSYPQWRSIQALDLQAQSVRIFSNKTLLTSYSHAKSASTQTQFTIGPYQGGISEILLFPALTDTKRIEIYNNVTTYYKTLGALDGLPNTILPQDWKYQADIYNWLKTIQESDVSTNSTTLSWDGTHSSPDELSELWVSMVGGKAGLIENAEVVRVDAKHFVLNDNAGSGIEGSGVVNLFRYATDCAFWFSQNLKNANGTQGNPLYQSPNLARRGLVIMAVEMMQTDKLQMGSSYWSNVDFGGGALLGWVSAYQKFKHLLPTAVQSAFETGFIQIVRRIEWWGAHDINGNMDTKAIAAVAHVYNIASGLKNKDLCVRAAKKLLFGSSLLTPQTTDYKLGLYRRAGYIDEGDSPETSYNGVSLFYITEALSVTSTDPNWEFLKEVVTSMAKFKVHQFFPEPDGHWEGPSGYAGRTGNSYVFDQRNPLWRDLAVSYFTPYACLLRGARSILKKPVTIQTVPDMVKEINQAIIWYNGKAFTTPVPQVAPKWKESHWPTDNVYYPRPSWYAPLKEVQDAKDSRTLYPYETASPFDIKFDEEFWAYKNNDSVQDFGFFIETLRDAGNYDGWYGGSLQTFWTKNGGIFLLARHDKSGDEPDQNENTRVWSEIDSWATHHVWGRNVAGKAFSTACTERMIHPVDYFGASAKVTTLLGTSTQKGQEVPGVLVDDVFFTNSFTALSNGIELSHEILGSRQTLSELYVSLPVYLRDKNQTVPDTHIEYLFNNSWIELPTTLVTTTKLRLTKIFNSTPNHLFVTLDKPRQVKVSSQIWEQSYQGTSRCRNIDISLHPVSGVSTVLDPKIEMSLQITTA